MTALGSRPADSEAGGVSPPLLELIDLTVDFRVAARGISLGGSGSAQWTT